MPERSVPASLIWLVALVALAIAAAIGAGVTIYLETTRATRTQAEAITRGKEASGREAIGRYGCGGCHVIPGIANANGQVGPDLSHVAVRAEIAGTLANDPEQMVRWLMHPQAIKQGCGMPDQGVGERDARDMAAYLYTSK